MRPRPAVVRANSQRPHSEATPCVVVRAEAVADLRAGKFVVVLDDADRENEGDLIMVAEHASQEALAFLVEHSSGYVCIGMTGEALDRLQLPLQVRAPPYALKPILHLPAPFGEPCVLPKTDVLD